MYERLVNDRVARLLLFAGFDVKCRAGWNLERVVDGKPTLQGFGKLSNGQMVPTRYKNSKLKPGLVAAPTLQVAHKWLRRRFGVTIVCRPVLVAADVVFAPEVFRRMTYDDGIKVELKHYSECLKVYHDYEEAMAEAMDWVLSDLLGFEDELLGEPSEVEAPTNDEE